jgi:DNA-binding NarL/FixJ family response regulator
MIRVLVVDDQVLIRVGLVALIDAAPGFEVVGQAADGHEAIAQAAVDRPDVVLMDIRMPGLGGIKATEQILAAAGTHRPGVLILTAFDFDEYVYAGLRAGANGFLLKDAPPERLLAAIDAVAAGEMLFAPSVTRRLVEAYTRRHPFEPQLPADVGVLTARETQVFRLVARGLANADIAGRLRMTESTVKTHLNRAMAKLNLSSRAQVVVFAYESGLVTPGRS